MVYAKMSAESELFRRAESEEEDSLFFVLCPMGFVNELGNFHNYL